MTDYLDRIESALGAMGSLGPKNLTAYLEKPGPDFETASGSEIGVMLDSLLADDPNAVARLRFSSLLRSWDNAKDAKWANGSSRNTEERRGRKV